MTPIPVVASCTILQMSTFSIGGADDEDDFAELSNTKTTAASGKADTVKTPGAVPLKTPQPAKGESSYLYCINSRNELNHGRVYISISMRQYRTYGYTLVPGTLLVLPGTWDTTVDNYNTYVFCADSLLAVPQRQVCTAPRLDSITE